VHDMYLVEVKKPEESHYAWDYYKILKIIPGEEAFPTGERGWQPASRQTLDATVRSADVAFWHVASFRCRSEVGSLLERSGHKPAAS
jgi:hypothetical protein